MSILSFLINDGLFILKNEIEIFNPSLKLLRNPNWLSLKENRQIKRHASIIFIINDEEQAKKAIQKKLYIAGLQLVTESYKSIEVTTQC